MLSRVVTNQIVDATGKKSYCYEENVEPYRSISLFEGLTPKKDPIKYKDIEDNDLYIIFQYTDINNVENKEEIKLNKTSI